MLISLRVYSVYLTSKDVDHRAQGTKLLSALLQNLTTLDLSLDEGMHALTIVLWEAVMCICSFFLVQFTTWRPFSVTD